jgi:hypothetical protein
MVLREGDGASSPPTVSLSSLFSSAATFALEIGFPAAATFLIAPAIMAAEA